DLRAAHLDTERLRHTRRIDLWPGRGALAGGRVGADVSGCERIPSGAGGDPAEQDRVAAGRRVEEPVLVAGRLAERRAVDGPDLPERRRGEDGERSEQRDDE